MTQCTFAADVAESEADDAMLLLRTEAKADFFIGRKSSKRCKRGNHNSAVVVSLVFNSARFRQIITDDFYKMRIVTRAISAVLKKVGVDELCHKKSCTLVMPSTDWNERDLPLSPYAGRVGISE